jgi:hypothetical protein
MELMPTVWIAPICSQPLPSPTVSWLTARVETVIPAATTRVERTIEEIGRVSDETVEKRLMVLT